MWNFRKQKEYEACVADLLSSDAVLSMQQFPQHAKGISCFDHSVLVSYASFRLCSLFGLDASSAARGGLLHDLYLYNWQQVKAHPRHLWEHPLAALKNAEARFSLNEIERDVIATHMFPVTLSLPHRYMESFVVSCMDKVCAVAELLHRCPTRAVQTPAAPRPLTAGAES